jgi:hypothetical protein
MTTQGQQLSVKVNIVPVILVVERSKEMKLKK